MKTILMAGIVGVVLFALSASASWFLLNQKEEPKTEVVVDENGPEEDAGVPPLGKGVKKKEQLPVAVRPEMPLSVEAVLQLSDSIRQKEQDVLVREKAAEKAEQNIRLLFEDLKLERAELTAMLDGMEAKLQMAQNSIVELKQENQSMTTKSQELAKLNQELEKKKDAGDALDEIGLRVQTVKPWFEGLEDEQAANYLKEFANNGDLEFAVRLLKNLQQRKASKILAALNDPEFVQQLINALTEPKSEETPKTGTALQRSRFLR